MIFDSREDAGTMLGRELLSKTSLQSPILIALPGGGVPVAVATSKQTGWPVTVLVSRKLRSPWNRELAIGAITASGPPYFNPFYKSSLKPDTSPEFDARDELETQKMECRRREKVFKEFLFKNQHTGAIPVLIDDGIATGATMIAAIRLMKFYGVKNIYCAVPVCSPDIAARIQAEGATLVCLDLPVTMMAVGSFYRAFPQVDEESAVEMLKNQKIFLKNLATTVPLKSKSDPLSRDPYEESNE